ncbi:unnamed protein product [Sympodiomycopsis kandeliae]
MVLFRNHIKAAGGEPQDYAESKSKEAQSGQETNGTAANGHADLKSKKSFTHDLLSPRQSSSSRRHTNGAPQRSKKSEPRLVSAYDVTLLLRSQNPTADAHDPNLAKNDLPSHHVPSFVSVASKAIQRQGHSGSYISRQRAKFAAKRDSEATKSTKSLPPAYWRAGGSKRFAQPAASQHEFSKSSLPLLSFQNPWDSFQPPTPLNVWQGLKWGLPEGYEEGGHGKYRGGGRHSSKEQEYEQAVEAELGTGWNDVEVQTPNWGWTESERATWLTGPHVEKELEAEHQNTASGQAAGDTGFGKRKEWQDPRAEQPANFARVAWLGHATTLLQLPPLANPITRHTDPSVENQPGSTEGGIQEHSIDESAARKLISQISDVKPEQMETTTDGTKKKSIVIRDTGRFPARNRENKAKGPRDGLPTTEEDAESSSSDSESEEEEGVDEDGEGGDAAPSDEHVDDQVPDSKRARVRAKAARPRQSKRRQSSAHRNAIDNTRDRSINIIFDPIFSKRCSPSQTVGPVRFTEPPCQAEDLPPIDLIMLSHDHYDHSDVESLKKILDRRGQAVHVFVGLGNKDWLVSSCGFKRSQVSELDWWDEAILTASGSPIQAGDETRAALRIICTPAQHGSGRVPGGKDSTLWCSWMVETITPAKASADAESYSRQDRWRAFFAGDTGLRRHGEKFTNRKSPVCPAFEEAAKRYGTPHLMLLPISIGSSLSYLRSKDPFPRRYSPFPRVSESLTSCIHMDAEDAVTMMELMTGYKPKDRKDAAASAKQAAGGQDHNNAKQSDGDTDAIVPLSLAVHFGTFVRNKQQTKNDVKNLHGACKRHGITFGRTKEGRFLGPTDSVDQRKNSEPATNGHADPSEQHSEVKPGNDRGKFLVAHQGETVWIKI